MKQKKGRRKEGDTIREERERERETEVGVRTWVLFISFQLFEQGDMIF